MKKYVKPVVYCESFELDQHIAGNCQLIANSTLSMETASCNATGTLLGMDIINGFLKGDTDCSAQEVDFEGYCYYAGAIPLPFVHNS